MKSYDSVVIGEGPAGVTAALYLTRSGCSVLLVEKLTTGGQILQTSSLENYPGFPKGIKGYELADLFAAHLDGLGNLTRMVTDVESVEGEAGNFTVKLKNNESVSAKTIIVCTGAKHRKLGVEREEELTGHGVSYCALCDGNFFRGKDVAVVGGGNAALEESLYLSNIVHTIHLIHRRDAFRARQVYQDRLLSDPKIELHLSSTVQSLHGSGDLTGITVKNLKTNQTEEIPCEAIFIYVGFEPVTSFLPANLEKDPAGFIVTDTEMRSSIPGIFAAGDIRSKLCRQVITAAGDGATAAQAAFVFLEQLHA
ncbi:MAG: thioredoxin-disulfide reductase [Desulfovibrionaceae bacterium]|nr:thioredoxin-disulfide reductase [Desulfovibrionaceae bacterium]